MVGVFCTSRAAIHAGSAQVQLALHLEDPQARHVIVQCCGKHIKKKERKKGDSADVQASRRSACFSTGGDAMSAEVAQAILCW